MKYRCLIFDHDDTVVNSTVMIHYPALLGYLKEYRNGVGADMTKEQYFEYNFDPGIYGMFRDILGMNDEDVKEEEAYWVRYVEEHVPKAFPGIKEILETHRKNGGLFFMSSHSFRNYIIRDFRKNDLPLPDEIYGWELPKELRKPAPYSIEQIEKNFHVKREEMLMIDDLRTGYDMAKATGIAFAAAGWAHTEKSIEDFMRSHADYYCKTVNDLRAVLEE